MIQFPHKATINTARWMKQQPPTYQFEFPYIAYSRSIANVNSLKLCYLSTGAILRGGLGGPWSPQIFGSPQFGPPVLCLTSHSSLFDWHIQQITFSQQWLKTIIAKPYVLYSIFPQCMIRWVVLCDGLSMGVIDDDTHQWLLGFCVKFIQTAVVVVKASLRS